MEQTFINIIFKEIVFRWSRENIFVLYEIKLYSLIFQSEHSRA